MKRIVTVLLVIVFACLPLAACADNGASTDLAVENDRLNTSLNQLIEDFETLKAQYEDAAKQLADMTEDLGEAQAERDEAVKLLEEKEAQLQVAEETIQGFTGGSGTETETAAGVDALAADSLVYVSGSGDKYHVEGCSYLGENHMQATLEEAESQGLEPCSRCIGQ